MSKVLVPLANGFEEIEAVTVIDILRRAGIEVVIAAIFKKNVAGAHDINIKADAHLEDINLSEFDAIILPGGLPGAEHLAKSVKLQKILQNMDKNKKIVAAICAAPWALATSNILKNSYTCYPSFEKIINHPGYNPNEDVVVDQNIITSRGPATAMVFALTIVEKLKGKEICEKLKNDLLFK